MMYDYQPEGGLEGELKAASAAMARSFHVRLISTFHPDLVCAPADARADDWLTHHNPEFDQFPVRERDRTIGVLLRGRGNLRASVRDAMHPLGDGIIVSADMPIAELIPLLREQHFRLVVRGGSIDGLVTQSDLLKLPVRMLVFGLVSHLELCLRELVRRKGGNTDWLERLPLKRREDLRKHITRLSGQRLEPDPLEITNLSDLVEVLGQEPGLGHEFRKQLDQVRLLRNDVAHAKTYIKSVRDVRNFVERFELLNHWIERVAGMVGELNGR